MNAPKRPGKDRAIRSKEARKAGVSQEKYESNKLNEAQRELSRKMQQERRPNVPTRENVMRKKEGSQKTATQPTPPSKTTNQSAPKRQLTVKTTKVSGPKKQLMMRTTKTK
jgi:hypothetical protein